MKGRNRYNTSDHTGRGYQVRNWKVQPRILDNTCLPLPLSLSHPPLLSTLYSSKHIAYSALCMYEGEAGQKGETMIMKSTVICLYPMSSIRELPRVGLFILCSYSRREGKSNLTHHPIVKKKVFLLLLYLIKCNIVG